MKVLAVEEESAMVSSGTIAAVAIVIVLVVVAIALIAVFYLRKHIIHRGKLYMEEVSTKLLLPLSIHPPLSSIHPPLSSTHPPLSSIHTPLSDRKSVV